MSEDLAAYEGLFSSESLNVRLGFTRAAHEAAAARHQAGALPEEIKSYVHELTHYVQATTTPYGLFMHYCRQLQTMDTITLVRALLDAGVAFKRPLLEHAPLTVEGAAGAVINGALGRWRNTEVLIASLNQDQSKLDRYLDRLTAVDARIRLVPLFDTFRRVQGGIAHFITVENAARKQHGMPPWDSGAFDVSAINAEGDALGSDSERALERVQAGLDAFGNPWGAQSLLESAATAAEWAESGAGLPALRAYAADTSDPDLAMYKRCLELGLEAIPADDLPQFAFTYIALCELALHAPLLPQHAGLRAGRADPRELFPALRFQMMLGPVGHVRPLQGLADVARFNFELCEVLGWVHPTQIIATAIDGPAVVADQRAQRYIWAQTERARRQHAFTNLARRTSDLSADGEQFRQRYGFPVIEYTDRTFYINDKDALWALTTQHLLMKTMRQVMLGTTLTVECPYRGAPAESETLTSWLQDQLQTIFHRQFPMARVKPRR